MVAPGARGMFICLIRTFFFLFVPFDYVFRNLLGLVLMTFKLILTFHSRVMVLTDHCSPCVGTLLRRMSWPTSDPVVGLTSHTVMHLSFLCLLNPETPSVSSCPMSCFPLLPPFLFLLPSTYLSSSFSPRVYGHNIF